MKHRALAAVVGGLLLAETSGGCARQTPVSPRHLAIGFDTSGSNRPSLAVQVHAAIRVIRQLDPHRDQLTLYRVDADCVEFFDNPPPASLERLQALLGRELQVRPQRPGTRPALFWQRVAGRVRETTTPFSIFFFTDGQNDGGSAGDQSLLQQSAQELAGNTQIERVVLCGVEPEVRAGLRRDLALLKIRLEFRGMAELEGRTRIAWLDQ